MRDSGQNLNRIYKCVTCVKVQMNCSVVGGRQVGKYFRGCNVIPAGIVHHVQVVRRSSVRVPLQLFGQYNVASADLVLITSAAAVLARSPSPSRRAFFSSVGNLLSDTFAFRFWVANF
jgi:hypothetical protein